MKFKGQVTIKDIAEELNISTSTVSRALKDHPAISDATKKAVNEMANKLNYQPNTLAMGLRQRRTKTIGVVIPEVVHFFFSTVISGIEEVAHSHGYSVILTQSNEEYERERLNIQSLYNHRVDGILMDVAMNTSDFQHIEDIRERGTPIVYFDRLVESLPGSKVITDDFRGAYLATKHLVDLGYTRIAHLAGPPGLSITKNRLEGYKKALIDSKLGIDENLIIPGVGIEVDKSKSIAREMLMWRHRPQAVFCVNDPAALGTLSAAQELGIKVPDELAIIGFSNWQFTEFTHPTLTTVDQPGYKIGYEAASILIKEIEADEDDMVEEQTIVLDATLIIRESAPVALE